MCSCLMISVFLTSGVKFIYEMREMGFDMCKPEVAEIEEKKCDLKQVYNPKLGAQYGGKDDCVQ